MPVGNNKPRIAIVHDWLYGGGAELVVEQLHKMFPDAPIYTSYCSDEWRARLNNKVVTGYLQAWPFAKLRKFLPVLRQHWFKNLDMSGYDLIISSSGNGEAKFVRAKEGAKHVCYCHSPVHFYWRKYNEYLRSPGIKPAWLARLGLAMLVKPLRRRDYQAAQRVDYFVANSSHIQSDISEFYHRESVVIHPPVDVAEFSKVSRAKHTKGAQPRFIMWGRHVPYKRFDLAVDACNQLGIDLVVVGEGPATNDLKARAGKTVSFAGFATKENLMMLASGADAFIFTSEEDFGIAPIEALATGLPVIAFKAGGALDYVKPGKNGEFFEEQTVESLVAALSSFDPAIYSTQKIKRSVSQFSQARFAQKFAEFYTNLWLNQ